MSKHLETDLEYLEQNILAQSSLVEEMISKAYRSLRELRGDVAIEIIAQEPKVNQREIRIEEECLKILALHQPVAVDLRRVTTVLKINAELERIADLAVNIAERTQSLTQFPEFPVPATLEKMAKSASRMVHAALDAFVNQDVKAARAVCAQDDEVDGYNREMISELRQMMCERSSVVEPALHLFSASRQIERIADHATNIAEDVVYLVEGEITRHQAPKKHTMVKPHVLVVEDDKSLADVLSYNLDQAGYDVSVARDGQDGLQQAEVKIPDLVLLDLMLPVVDGLDVCRRLRASAVTRDMLIVMLTAKSEESDQLVGFSVGADDYVNKPFSIRVLLERIKALLRRRDGSTDDHDIVSSQGVMVDRRGHRASAGDKMLDLTPSEFSILDVLIRQPGRAFSRSELIDAALGSDTIVLERTIDVHVRALRQKLGSYSDVVETVRGIGYRFRDPRRS